MSIRIGHGYDVHAFGPGDHVTLGGQRVPHERGLVAHSDGDVLIHALCDAILGALALGDIGRHFPAGDPQWKDADSRAVPAPGSGDGWRAWLAPGQCRSHPDRRSAQARAACRGDPGQPGGGPRASTRTGSGSRPPRTSAWARWAAAKALAAHAVVLLEWTG